MNKYKVLLLLFLGFSPIWTGKQGEKKAAGNTYKAKKKTKSMKRRKRACQVCDQKFLNKSNKINHMMLDKHYPRRFFRVPLQSLIFIEAHRSFWKLELASSMHKGPCTRSMRATLKEAINKPKK